MLTKVRVGARPTNQKRFRLLIDRREQLLNTAKIEERLIMGVHKAKTHAIFLIDAYIIFIEKTHALLLINHLRNIY